PGSTPTTPRRCARRRPRPRRTRPLRYRQGSAVSDTEPDCRVRVYDSRQRGIVPLPLSEDPERSGGRVLKLYVCGITPYDSGHMGHAFTYSAFDVLVRWVEASGVRVRYVQNVT